MRKHRLMAIGDSLTQGFVSDAIQLTDRSYPAIIAREMGLADQELSCPHHSRGWLPLNLWERGPEIQRPPLYGAYHNLVVWGLEVEDAHEKALTRPADPRDHTSWRPDHFEKGCGRLVDEVGALGAERALMANGPHVTLHPLIHGIGGHLSSDRRYFQYYPCPWIQKGFDPSQHPYLAGEQAQHIGLPAPRRLQPSDRGPRSPLWAAARLTTTP